jgi:predicted transposase/invertase (TIGR01784 family)
MTETQTEPQTQEKQEEQMQMRAQPETHTQEQQEVHTQEQQKVRTQMQTQSEIPKNRKPKAPRPLEELDLLDDFLFQEMLLQEDVREEFCQILLSTILGKTIRKVRVVSQKSVRGIDTNRHGICMDAYIEDVSEITVDGMEMLDASVLPDIYDVEPNRTYEKGSLPKRVRYYHGMIDSRMLEKGVDYSQLRNVVIIVILPYDPFDRNRMVYTVRNQCIEDSSIHYEDGATKIFLYTKGTEGNPSQKLRDMLKYMEKTTEENITNQSLAAMHRLVEEVKNRKEVGINYMKSWELDEMHREEGRREGLREGEERLNRLNQLNRILIKQNRIDDLERAANDRAYQQQLLDELVPEKEKQEVLI